MAVTRGGGARRLRGAQGRLRSHQPTVHLQEIVVPRRRPEPGAAPRDLVRRARGGRGLRGAGAAALRAAPPRQRRRPGPAQPGRPGPDIEKVAFALPAGGSLRARCRPRTAAIRILKRGGEDGGPHGALRGGEGRDPAAPGARADRRSEYETYMEGLRKRRHHRPARARGAAAGRPCPPTSRLEPPSDDEAEPAAPAAAPPAGRARGPPRRPPDDDEITTTPQARPERVAAPAPEPAPAGLARRSPRHADADPAPAVALTR